MNVSQTVYELWNIFMRRVWVVLFVGTVGITGSVFVAYVVPPVYEAQGTILVESQQIPSELAGSTVTQSAVERLEVIKQLLRTRDNMIRLINDLNLYADRTDLTLTEKIDLLRDAMVIRPITIDDRRRRARDTIISAFTVNVTYTDPLRVTQIANALVTTALDQNLQTRTRQASETLSFFNDEESRLFDQLTQVEAELTQFKRDNENALPDSLGFRRTELSRLIDNDLLIDRRILELEEERGALQAQLAISADLQAETSPEERLLRQLEAELVQKSAIFSEDHREVRSLTARIAALQAQTPADRTAAEGGAQVDAKTSGRIGAIQRQIDLIATQIVLLQDQKTVLATQRSEIEESIARTPGVEMNLNQLDRRLTELKEQYQVAVRKRALAETGERLEINQQAERFEIIEQPVQPEEPISPNRPKIVIMGSAATVGLALGLAFLLELINPVIRSAEQLERRLELRPMAVIPYVRTRSERFARGVRIVSFLLIVAIGIPAILFLLDEYYLPLEVIGTKIAEKSGLDEIFRAVESRF